MPDAAFAARIAVTARNIADLDRRLSQIDSAIEEAAYRGKANAVLAAIEGQESGGRSLMSASGRPIFAVEN
jgi:hypothetical protein